MQDLEEDCEMKYWEWEDNEDKQDCSILAYSEMVMSSGEWEPDKVFWSMNHWDLVPKYTNVYLYGENSGVNEVIATMKLALNPDWIFEGGVDGILTALRWPADDGTNESSVVMFDRVEFEVNEGLVKEGKAFSYFWKLTQRKEKAELKFVKKGNQETDKLVLEKGCARIFIANEPPAEYFGKFLSHDMQHPVWDLLFRNRMDVFHVLPKIGKADKPQLQNKGE